MDEVAVALRGPAGRLALQQRAVGGEPDHVATAVFVLVIERVGADGKTVHEAQAVRAAFQRDVLDAAAAQAEHGRDGEVALRVLHDVLLQPLADGVVQGEEFGGDGLHARFVRGELVLVGVPGVVFILVVLFFLLRICIRHCAPDRMRFADQRQRGCIDRVGRDEVRNRIRVVQARGHVVEVLIHAAVGDLRIEQIEVVHRAHQRREAAGAVFAQRIHDGAAEIRGAAQQRGPVGGGEQGRGGGHGGTL